MNELEKIKRVIEKVCPVSEVLLVIDATTGQNGLQQARVFTEAVQVTGIILTKLDGSARGGIALAIEDALDIPIKFVGTGESIDDLDPFNPDEYIRGLIS
jgi:fused signal recognition particle receptor